MTDEQILDLISEFKSKHSESMDDGDNLVIDLVGEIALRLGELEPEPVTGWEKFKDRAGSFGVIFFFIQICIAIGHVNSLFLKSLFP